MCPCVAYPFIVVKEESAGLQSPEVKSSFECIERRNPGSGTKEPVSTENSLTGHLRRGEQEEEKKGFTLNSSRGTNFSVCMGV